MTKRLSLKNKELLAEDANRKVCKARELLMDVRSSAHALDLYAAGALIAALSALDAVTITVQR